jgi:hypothetical protein
VTRCDVQFCSPVDTLLPHIALLPQTALLFQTVPNPAEELDPHIAEEPHIADDPHIAEFDVTNCEEMVFPRPVVPWRIRSPPDLARAPLSCKNRASI